MLEVIHKTLAKVSHETEGLGSYQKVLAIRETLLGPLQERTNYPFKWG
jgi:hypothetical protein